MERETELEERQRHDREIAEDNRARQERQGVVSAKEENEDTENPSETSE